MKAAFGPWRVRALACAVGVVLYALAPTPARALGDVGSFEPRILVTSNIKGAAHPTAATRWTFELVERTSAPARQRVSAIRADDPMIVEAPFLYWSGSEAISPLSYAEIGGLKKFFGLGGMLFVDDAAPTSAGEPGAFGQSARRELARVLPDGAPFPLPTEHVVYRTFYFLQRAEGRILGKKTLDAIVQSGDVRVLFSSHDVGGALARSPSGLWEETVLPGGQAQRERAVRLAVNIAMYGLCSNYKDDQVHAPFLMRKRAVLSDP